MKIRKLLAPFVMLFALTGLGACNEKEKDEEISKDKEELKEAFLADANEVKVESDYVVFEDASDDSNKRIKKNPETVYNLYASFTTLWYEAGGECKGVIGGDSAKSLYNTYIGRDITQDEGVEVLATSSSGKKWSTETIIAGKPDLIICSTAMSGYQTIKSPADAANIPVIAVSYDSFSDYLKWFRVFSLILDNENLWNDIALKALDETVDVIIEANEIEESKNVYSMFSGSGNWQTNTEYTVVGEMIKSLGAKNIASSWSNPTNVARIDIDLEKVLQAKPELILIQCHQGVELVKEDLNTQYGDNPLWKQIVKEVGENNIIFLEPQYYHNKPNSKFAYAYQNLAKSLYPEHEFSFEK